MRKTARVGYGTVQVTYTLDEENILADEEGERLDDTILKEVINKNNDIMPKKVSVNIYFRVEQIDFPGNREEAPVEQEDREVQDVSLLVNGNKISLSGNIKNYIANLFDEYIQNSTNIEWPNIYGGIREASSFKKFFKL